MKKKSQAIARRKSTRARNTYHERLCTVCRHPERDAIEEEFLHWHNPCDIADDFDVESRAVYRRAHAFGLFELRDRNLRFALGHIVQRAQNVRASADSIVRAVHAYTRVNSVGEWVEPPAHVIFSSGAQLAAATKRAQHQLPPQPPRQESPKLLDASSPLQQPSPHASPQSLPQPLPQILPQELLSQLDTTGRTENETTL